jgi:tetratricopeptide (TPR) repeat protein
VAIDRDEALRKAEKLLRQGRLDGAIAEYERIIQAFPDDIATAGALGDLYGRAGQAGQAVGQYTRIGDHWLREGMPGKAAATYKKVLKLDPHHESALLQLVEACAQQGQLAEAKGHLRSAIDKRRNRNDQSGADSLVIRLSELDPNDFEARLAASYIRVRTGKATAADLLDLSRELDIRGRTEEAEALLEEVVRRDPGAIEVRLRLTRAALTRNELDRARQFLPDATSSTDQTLLLTAGEVLLKLDEIEDARELLARYLSLNPEGAEAVAALGDPLPQPARYAMVDLLVDQASSNHDYRKAARRLQTFLDRAPRHVPALLRLVEVCVDGDLDATLTTAQEELAEAYLSTDDADKARVIAEDLLLRNPRSVTHRDRLRRVLVTLGEEDPEAVIAERLGFVQDDDEFGAGGDEEPESDELDELDAGQAEPPVSVQATAGDGAHGRDTGQAGTPAPEAREEGIEFEAVDFEEWQEPEVDLSSAIDKLSPAAPEPAAPAEPEPVEQAASEPAAAAEAAPVLDNVLSSRRAALDATLPPGDHAARNFRVGQTYAAANMVKEAAEAFEKAARDPRYRFRSAQALARLFRKQQMLKEAVEWLDIAAEASAPSVDEHRAALYEWADALEATGETTRALVVLLDLVAEQGDYKDARARIDRLSRVQA